MRHLNNWYPYQKPSNNRSSKNLNLIMGRKNILRCVSLDQLKEWASQDVTGAGKELERRLARIERRKNK